MTNENSSVILALEAFFLAHPDDPASPIVAGFSGGPDSTALLVGLVRKFGPDRIVAAHFDHRLRGEESDGDREFCETFCRERGIALRTAERDVAGYARERKIGVEEAARELRYGFFETVRLETGAGIVTTGHTADDFAETVFANFVRGTKLRGLKGIPETSGYLRRPLLRVRKSEILEFLRNSDIPFRTDSSNSDDAFLRNRIRNRIFPEIRELGADIVTATENLGKYATALDAYLESETAEFLGGPGTSGEFSIDAFAAKDPFFQKETLARLFARVHKTGVGFSEGMAEEMLRFCHGRAGGKEKAFGDLVLSRAKGKVAYRSARPF